MSGAITEIFCASIQIQPEISILHTCFISTTPFVDEITPPNPYDRHIGYLREWKKLAKLWTVRYCDIAKCFITNKFMKLLLIKSKQLVKKIFRNRPNNFCLPGHCIA